MGRASVGEGRVFLVQRVARRSFEGLGLGRSIDWDEGEEGQKGTA